MSVHTIIIFVLFVVCCFGGLGFFLSFFLFFLRARFAARRVLRASRFACFAAFCFAAFACALRCAGLCWRTSGLCCRTSCACLALARQAMRWMPSLHSGRWLLSPKGIRYQIPYIRPLNGTLIDTPLYPYNLGTQCVPYCTPYIPLCILYVPIYPL